jgi:AcrR family transcriptional regulator
VVSALGLRDRKKLETWRGIRAAAFALFEERGYEAVSADDIAAAANVSHSTFFNYFPTKEAVVFDLDPEAVSTCRDLLAMRPAGEPLWTSLSGLLVHLVTVLGEEALVLRRLMVASPTLAQSSRNVADRIRDALLEGVAKRDSGLSLLESTLVVNVALAAVQAAYAVWEPGEGMPRLVEMVRVCLDKAGSGLGTAAAG